MNLTINDYILITLVILSVYFDLTKKKIPNIITFPVILWGLLTYSIFNGFDGFKFSMVGFLVGLAIFIIPFILGGMGGGDVKMMAAIGALKGWKFVLTTAIYSGLVGGIIVIIYLIYKKRLCITLKKTLGIILKPILFILTLTFNNHTLKRVNDYFITTESTIEKHYIPYGVAIGLGALLVFFIWGETMNRFFKLKKNEKGQSMVEFALVLPLLILIVIGIIDFGWLFNGKITLTSAAREGARVAAIIKNETTATAAINETADLSGLTINSVQYSYINGGINNVNRVMVKVEGSMNPLVGLFITGPVNIDSEAFMRME